MGGVNQICFEHKINNTRRKDELRLLNNEENKIVYKKSKSNKINITIKKTYQKNFRKNSIDMKENRTEQIIKDNYQKIKTNDSKGHNILKKTTRNKSIDLSKINRDTLYNINQNTIKLENKKYIKGELTREGKYCKVYSGFCTSNGDLVAIKVYDNLSEQQKKKILDNKKNMYTLNHPNIIKTISVLEEDNGDLNVVSESVNVNDVEELINKFGILDEAIIQKYCRQLLKGLEYLHKKKIYHKNLKPSNILVDIDGTIKISNCLIDSIILGDEKDIYDNLINSNKIEYYIPPFFIKYIINKYYNKEKENNNIINTNEMNEFEDWQSYDLWFIGCVIIEVASGKKPWSYYNFKNNTELFNFLNETNLIPTTSKRLSAECQELIQVLLNHSLTSKDNIYEIIFNLNFFKKISSNFIYPRTKTSITNSIKINDSQAHFMESEESQIGKFLERNKVINILNSHNNATFTLSFTNNNIERNSSNDKSLNNNLSISIKMNKNNDSKNKIEVSLRKVKTIKSDMPIVKETQTEHYLDFFNGKSIFISEDI